MGGDEGVVSGATSAEKLDWNVRFCLSKHGGREADAPKNTFVVVKWVLH